MRGHVDAQAQFGLKHIEGRGVARNDVEALAWLYVALSNGADRKILSLRQVEEIVDPKVILLAQQRATEISTMIATGK